MLNVAWNAIAKVAGIGELLDRDTEHSNRAVH
jgi:hypothetical protein